MGFLRPLEVGAKNFVTGARWFGSRVVAKWSDPCAVEFYDAIAAGGFEFDELINVVPSLRVMYVTVPKVASTRIRQTLAAAVGRRMISLRPGRRRRFRGPQGPRSMKLAAFHTLATDPKTLRFSFVRNPYARAVSCWADKLQGKPLVPGDDFVDAYLARKQEINADLPAGPDRTLSFSDFVTYAGAFANRRVDAHLQAQDDILAMPGIALDFVARIERFPERIVRVLDHIGAANGIRGDAANPVNPSKRGPARAARPHLPGLRARLRPLPISASALTAPGQNRRLVESGVATVAGVVRIRCGRCLRAPLLKQAPPNKVSRRATAKRYSAASLEVRILSRRLYTVRTATFADAGFWRSRPTNPRWR
jgi:hypothetical protein